MRLIDIYKKFYKPFISKHIIALIILLFYCGLFFFIPSLMERIYNYAFINPDISQLLLNILFITGLYILVIILDLQLERILKVCFLRYPMEKVKISIIKKSFYLPIEYYYKNNPGEIYKNLSRNTSMANQNFYILVRQLSLIIKILFSFIVIIRISWIYSIIFISVNSILLIANYFFTKEEIKSLDKMHDNPSYSYIYDTLDGHFDLYSNNLSKYFLKRNQNALTDMSKWSEKNDMWYRLEEIVSELIHKATPILIIAFLYFINPEKLIMDEFFGFYLIYLSIPKINALILFKQFMKKVETSWKPIIKFLDLTEEESGNNLIKNFNIYIKDLSISLRNRNLLDNVTLSIKEGNKLIITGKSGEGKSVLMNSLFGNFYEKKGSIYIGGNEIKDINLSKYRKNISYINTNPIIFDSTILENVILDTNSSKEQVISIIKKFDLEEFFERFKNLEENITDNNLSSGEKVIISFMRAVIRNPKIIFLDEATSSLDAKLEPLILSKINQLDNIIVIAISHKLSSVIYFDRIIHLEKGRIVEDIHPSQLDNSIYIKEYFKQQIEANSE